MCVRSAVSLIACVCYVSLLVLASVPFVCSESLCFQEALWMSKT